MEGMTYIESQWTEQTGGGCMVDVIVLNTGKVLAITDECVHAYDSLEAWNEGGEGNGYITLV